MGMAIRSSFSLHCSDKSTIPGVTGPTRGAAHLPASRGTWDKSPNFSGPQCSHLENDKAGPGQ